MPTTKKIRRAIEKNRGGWETATDSQVLIIWYAVTDDVREQYLTSLTTGVIEEVIADPIE